MDGLEIFHQLYKTEYDTIKSLNPEIENPERYIDQMLTSGEFDHKGYHPIKDFFSELLDLTIIKPLYEAATGKDIITDEELTDLEAGMKVLFAVVDLVTLGTAMGMMLR
jgi:hypothetical protein